ncbi:MAG TPA: hypothetical protein GXX53_03020 [Tissierellia bacterium]|nr:hypothetical protein [Tissierellia bacterium]
MIEVILFELISIVSLLFSLWLSFFEFAAGSKVFLVFLWVVFSSLIFALIHIKSRVYKISIILILMPLIFYRDIKSIAFLLLLTIFVYLYVKKSLLEGSHSEYAYKIKNTYVLCFILGYISAKAFGLDGHINTALPFYTIYFISSLILLRTIRHIDSNMDVEKIRKNNIKYLMLIALVTPISASQDLRNYIWIRFKYLFEKLMIIVFYPMYLIGKLFDRDWRKIKVGSSLFEEVGKDTVYNLELQEATEEAEIQDFTILKIIFASILFLMVVFIVYKLIMKSSTRQYSDISYTEEREFIRDTSRKKRRRWFFREKYPVDLREQVRFFYRKYLEKLKRENVNILKSDTSLDVNQKAREILDHGIDDLRKIYIKCRYSKEEITEEDVDNIKNIYHNL